MSKPRNPLLQMPEDHQARLADWLLGGMTYHEANLLVEKELGVKPSASLARYSKFWEAVCVPHLLQRRSRMAGTAAARSQEAAENPAEFDRATLDALQQKAYELAESPTSSARDVKSILSLLLKAKDQSLEERRLVLLERQAAQAVQTEKVLTDAELTAEQREQRIKEIYGRA